MTKEINYLKNTEKQVRLIELLIKAKKYGLQNRKNLPRVGENKVSK